MRRPIEFFKDVTIACKLLQERHPVGSRVTYASGKFYHTVVDKDGASQTFVNQGRLTKPVLLRTRHVEATHLRALEEEAAQEYGTSPFKCPSSLAGATRRCDDLSSGVGSVYQPSHCSIISSSEDDEDVDVESLAGSDARPWSPGAQVEPEPESALALAMLHNTEYEPELHRTELRRTLFVNEEDRREASRRAAAAGLSARRRDTSSRLHDTCHDSGEVRMLKEMLRDIEHDNPQSHSWAVPTPTSPLAKVRAAYKALTAWREYARHLGALCPQIARDQLMCLWLELEPVILNQLARKGEYFRKACALREAWRQALVLVHGEDSPHALVGELEPLVDEWIDLVKGQAQSEGKLFCLDDLELARNAGPAKSLTAMAVLERDYSGYMEGGLKRERFPTASSVGWGKQAREGGKVKKNAEGLSPQDPEWDVNGPRHFVFENARGELIDKAEGLAAYRREHHVVDRGYVHVTGEPGRDPTRRALARSLKGSKSELTAALRSVCKPANEYNALVADIFMGETQTNMVSDVFGMGEFQGRARRWMTTEANVSGRGELPRRARQDADLDAELASLRAPPPTLADGRSYFDALFEGHAGVRRLLEMLEVDSFETAIEQHMPIPEELWPTFPLTDEEVAHVDFEHLMPQFPDEDTLNTLRDEHCPKVNKECMDLLDRLAVHPDDGEQAQEQAPQEQAQAPQEQAPAQLWGSPSIGGG